MSCIEYPMPTGSVYNERKRLFAKLQKDERYLKARSCVHCTDTADSFNRYVSTYCHLKQEHIAGYKDKLDACLNCPEYRGRK